MENKLIFDDKSVYLPTLYKVTATGKTQVWTIMLRLYSGKDKIVNIKKKYLKKKLPDKYYSLIISRYGQEDGKIQEASIEITEGKNIGKSNETNVFEQGIKEMLSTWTQKIERKGYSLSKEDSKEQKIKPMLLAKYDDFGGRLEFPIMVQPKLDGVRSICHYDPSVGYFRFYSRNELEQFKYPVELKKIRSELNKNKFLKENPNVWLDGELYSNKLTFEEITGIVGKSNEPTEESLKKQKKIKFHVFDIFDLNNLQMPYKDRYKCYTKLLKDNKYVVPVKAYSVKNDNEVHKYFKEFLKEGNEGLVARDLGGLYELNSRSKKVLKLKEKTNRRI